MSMTEEEKKTIEIEDIEVLECELNFRPINSNYDKKILRAIFRMLNKVKKQQKELEQEKEKNKDMVNIKDIEFSNFINERYVSKDKIKEKIEEIYSYAYTTQEEKDEQHYAISILKELLEEE